jgi:hypothetical protein
LRDVLLGRQKLIGNGGPTHGEQRQNRNHAQEFHARRVASDCGQKRQTLVRFSDLSWNIMAIPHRILRAFSVNRPECLRSPLASGLHGAALLA